MEGSTATESALELHAPILLKTLSTKHLAATAEDHRGGDEEGDGRAFVDGSYKGAKEFGLVEVGAVAEGATIEGDLVEAVGERQEQFGARALGEEGDGGVGVELPLGGGDHARAGVDD